MERYFQLKVEFRHKVLNGQAFGLIDVSDAPADELYQVPGNGEWVALRLIIDHDGWRAAVARRREQGNPAVWGEAETETIVTARLIGMDKALGWLDQRLPTGPFPPQPRNPGISHAWYLNNTQSTTSSHCFRLQSSS